jgi:hypothetical protein
MRHSTLTGIVATAAAIGAGCDTGPTGPAAGPLLTGEWRAPEVMLSLDRSGGTTEYGCAHGGLSAPVILDADGRFDVAGIHVREHGGPIHEDEVVDSLPALYTGELVGGELTLLVRLPEETIGPFVLRRDAMTLVAKCL